MLIDTKYAYILNHFSHYPTPSQEDRQSRISLTVSFTVSINVVDVR